MKTQEKCTPAKQKKRAKAISRYLKALGIPANISGYRYLRCAIEMIIEDSSYRDFIVKGLYNDIADVFGGNGARIERSIRFAIEKGWGKGNATLIEELFGNSLDTHKRRPTNSEFIITIADYIQLNEPGEWNK